MPRGGRRSGSPGKAYGNRTDMNTNRTLPVRTAPGQAYGAAGAQAEAQRQIPLRPQPAPAPGGPSPQGLGATTSPIPLDAPTMRPNEPLTAGVDIGAGPGAPPMSQPATDPIVQELRAVFLAYPSEDLRELLEDVDEGRAF